MHSPLTSRYPLLHAQLPAVQLSIVALQSTARLQIVPKAASLTEIKHNQDTVYKKKKISRAKFVAEQRVCLLCKNLINKKTFMTLLLFVSNVQ